MKLKSVLGAFYAIRTGNSLEQAYPTAQHVATTL